MTASGPAAYLPFTVGIRPIGYGLRDEYVDRLQLVRSERTAEEVTVFLHGLNGSWRSWTPTLTALRGKRDVLGDVVAVDFEALTLPRTMSEMTVLGNCIKDVLGDRGWSRVRLVGHSTGGSLAAHMATVKHPRVDVVDLRLVSGAYLQLFEAASSPLLRTDWHNTTARAMGRFKIAALLGPVTGLALSRLSGRPAVGRAIGAGLYAHPDRVPTAVMSALASSFDYRALRNTLAIGRCYKPEQVYSEIRVPVRLAVGANDPLIGENDLSRLAEMVPDLAATVIADAGHFAHVEQPNATAHFLFTEATPKEPTA